MKIKLQEKVKDCYIAHLDRHHDSRGFFQELFNENKYDQEKWPQVSWSCSSKGVIRGLHCSPYAKLCTCIKGKLFDVAVDTRPDSPTYLNWTSTWLSEDEPKQFYIPPNCAHGFYAAEEDTMILYLQGGVFNPEKDMEFNWLDPAFEIEWPEKNCILSDKDRHAEIIA